MKTRRLDNMLLIITVVLSAIGLLMVCSSSYVIAAENIGDRYFFIKRHLAYLALGVLVFMITCRLRVEGWRKLSLPLFVISVLLLVLAISSPLASYGGGAYRWIELMGLRFQPSEFARLGTILFLAHLLTNRGDAILQLRQGVLLPLLLLAIVAALILCEPDFGSAVSIFVTGVVLLYLAGARFKHLLLTQLLIAPVALYMLLGSAYRRERLLTFLDPWQDSMNRGFQIIQSFIAIRSGGLFGQGLGDGVQKAFYLPAAHTDFVFAIIGEELGFVGMFVVIALFMLFVARGAYIAATSGARFHSLLAAGIVFSIGMQAFTNMAVVMGSLPTKGLTLPLISCGGSSLVATFAGLGILQAIAASRQERRR